MSVCFIKGFIFLKISQNYKTLFYKIFSRSLACLLKVSKTFYTCLPLKVIKLLILACLLFVRAPPPGPLRRGVVPLTGYPPSSQGFLSPPWARTWDHELRYPFEVVPTTNWASSSVGSGNYLEWVSKLMVPGSSP